MVLASALGRSMALLEDNTAVFIVRIWREPQNDVDAAPHCRGVVEHVRNQSRSYFTTLDELAAFMLPHLPCPDMSKASMAKRIRIVPANPSVDERNVVHRLLDRLLGH